MTKIHTQTHFIHTNYSMYMHNKSIHAPSHIHDTHEKTAVCCFYLHVMMSTTVMLQYVLHLGHYFSSMVVRQPPPPPSPSLSLSPPPPSPYVLPCVYSAHPARLLMKPHTSSTLHLLMSSTGFAVAESSPSMKRPPIEPERAAVGENDVSI